MTLQDALLAYGYTNVHAKTVGSKVYLTVNNGQQEWNYEVIGNAVVPCGKLPEQGEVRP